MYRPLDGNKTEGKAPTGHFFAIESQACTQCHTRDSIHSRQQAFNSSATIDVNMAQRVTTLEGEIGVLNASVTRNLVLGLVGGAAGGLVLGIVLSLLLARRLTGGKRGTQTVA